MDMRRDMESVSREPILPLPAASLPSRELDRRTQDFSVDNRVSFRIAGDGLHAVLCKGERKAGGYGEIMQIRRV
jgi:hypothetical protein